MIQLTPVDNHISLRYIEDHFISRIKVTAAHLREVANTSWSLWHDQHQLVTDWDCSGWLTLPGFVLTVQRTWADVPEPSPVRWEDAVPTHTAATAVPSRLHAPTGHAAHGPSAPLPLPQWPALLNVGPVPRCTTSLSPARLPPVPAKPGQSRSHGYRLTFFLVSLTHFAGASHGLVPCFPDTFCWCQSRPCPLFPWHILLVPVTALSLVSLTHLTGASHGLVPCFPDTFDWCQSRPCPLFPWHIWLVPVTALSLVSLTHLTGASHGLVPCFPDTFDWCQSRPCPLFLWHIWLVPVTALFLWHIWLVPVTALPLVSVTHLTGASHGLAPCFCDTFDWCQSWPCPLFLWHLLLQWQSCPPSGRIPCFCDTFYFSDSHCLLLAMPHVSVTPFTSVTVIASFWPCPMFLWHLLLQWQSLPPSGHVPCFCDTFYFSDSHCLLLAMSHVSVTPFTSVTVIASFWPYPMFLWHLLLQWQSLPPSGHVPCSCDTFYFSDSHCLLLAMSHVSVTPFTSVTVIASFWPYPLFLWHLLLQWQSLPPSGHAPCFCDTFYFSDSHCLLLAMSHVSVTPFTSVTVIASFWPCPMFLWHLLLQWQSLPPSGRIPCFCDTFYFSDSHCLLLAISHVSVTPFTSVTVIASFWPYPLFLWHLLLQWQSLPPSGCIPCFCDTFYSWCCRFRM